MPHNPQTRQMHTSESTQAVYDMRTASSAWINTQIQIYVAECTETVIALPHITKTAPHQGLCWVHRSHALIGLQPSDMRALSPLRPLTTEVAPQHSKHVPVVGQQLSPPLPDHCSEPSHAQHHNPTPWYGPRVVAQVREQAHLPILGGLRQPQSSAQHVLYAEGQGRPPC